MMTIPEAKECKKIGKSGDVLLWGDIDDPEGIKLYETVKAVEVLICFALGLDSSEG